MPPFEGSFTIDPLFIGFTGVFASAIVSGLCITWFISRFANLQQRHLTARIQTGVWISVVVNCFVAILMWHYTVSNI